MFFRVSPISLADRDKAERALAIRRSNTERRRQKLREPEPLLAQPYHLQVTTRIERRHLPHLTNRSTELIRAIEATGLLLRHASWHVSHDWVDLYFYWDMSYDADTLTEAEQLLPDNPDYAPFAGLIVEELKDIVVPMSAARRRAIRRVEGPAGKELISELPHDSRYVYVRVEYRVASDDLAEFAARLEASLEPYADSYDWYDGRAYIGITGQAGKLVQMWLVPESGAALAEQRLAATPWHELLQGQPSVKVLEPAPFDPVTRAHRDQTARARAPESSDGAPLGSEHRAPARLHQVTQDRRERMSVTLNTLGSRGLVVHDEDGFSWMKEADWRARHLSTKPAGVDARSLVTKLGKSIFVDLDQLRGLEEPNQNPPEGPGKAWDGELDSITFKERDKYYQIPLQSLQKLEGAAGDAGVMVKRGAIVAAIPRNVIPSGTYCVLVNLSSLK